MIVTIPEARSGRMRDLFIGHLSISAPANGEKIKFGIKNKVAMMLNGVAFPLIFQIQIESPNWVIAEPTIEMNCPIDIKAKPLKPLGFSINSYNLLFF